MRRVSPYWCIGIVALLTGCVSVSSNVKRDAIPAFERVLVITKLGYRSDGYAQKLAQSLPIEYESCSVAINPLSFDDADSLVYQQAGVCQSEVTLFIELQQEGFASRYASQPYLYGAEMRSLATNRAFWKANFWIEPALGGPPPIRTVVKRLLDDGVLSGTLPPLNSPRTISRNDT